LKDDINAGIMTDKAAKNEAMELRGDVQDVPVRENIAVESNLEFRYSKNSGMRKRENIFSTRANIRWRNVKTSEYQGNRFAVSDISREFVTPRDVMHVIPIEIVGPERVERKRRDGIPNE